MYIYIQKFQFDMRVNMETQIKFGYDELHSLAYGGQLMSN